MKYAIAEFNRSTGTIDDATLTWHEGTQDEAEEVVVHDHDKCALFYFGDVDRGIPLNPEATREEFEADPARLGICFYYSWPGYIYE